MTHADERVSDAIARLAKTGSAVAAAIPRFIFSNPRRFHSNVALTIPTNGPITPEALRAALLEAITESLNGSGDEDENSPGSRKKRAFGGFFDAPSDDSMSAQVIDVTEPSDDARDAMEREEESARQRDEENTEADSRLVGSATHLRVSESTLAPVPKAHELLHQEQQDAQRRKGGNTRQDERIGNSPVLITEAMIEQIIQKNTVDGHVSIGGIFAELQTLIPGRGKAASAARSTGIDRAKLAAQEADQRHRGLSI